jgi:hypothetical protein
MVILEGIEYKRKTQVEFLMPAKRLIFIIITWLFYVFIQMK